jgi:hypothetical protein
MGPHDSTGGVRAVYAWGREFPGCCTIGPGRKTMNVLKMLEHEEKKMANRLEGLRAAISALNGAGSDLRRKSGRKKHRTMSASARRRISLAQKARWAKVRAARKNA